MFLDPTSFFINLFGIILGIALSPLIFVIGNSSDNDPLKSFFRWMGVGIIFYTFSFISNLLSLFSSQLPFEIIHHLFMIVSIFIIGIGSINFYQEIRK